MLPQAPRRGEGQSRPIHFTYVNTPLGSTWPAYLAGKPQWLYTHQLQQSKPCVKEITGGELNCPLCEKLLFPTVRALCPLYRQADGKPVLVWINEESRDYLDALPLHCRLHVARERSKGSPISLLRCLDDKPRYETTLPERRVWADATNSILALFKTPALTEWYRLCYAGKEFIQEDTRPQKAATDGGNSSMDAGGSVGPIPVGMLSDRWFGRLPDAQREELIRQRNERFAEDAQKPKKNGKH